MYYLQRAAAKSKPDSIYLHYDLTVVNVNSNEIKTLDVDKPRFLFDLTHPVVLSLTPVAKINFELTAYEKTVLISNVCRCDVEIKEKF